MSELKPCPFCGGEAQTHNPCGDIDGLWYCICTECAACSGFEETKTEAIEAWNTRVGAHCPYAQPTDLTEGCALLAERTCSIVMVSPGWWECDSCGSSIYWDSCDENDPPACNYCPNCGAKVIGVDE